MTGWFLARSRREQVLVGILAVLLVLVVGYYGVVRPLDRGVESAKQDFAEEAMRAGRLAAKAQLLSEAGNAPRPVPSGALNVLLAAEAGERGFTLDRNQPAGDARAEIAIGSARAPAFLAWLSDLESRGVLTEQISMRRMDSGAVAITARLAKAGS